MPGPLAAQLAIALGYFQRGVLGATAVGLAFILPSFLMVLGISIAYKRFGGLWWMQALFYGIGAAVIAIIAIAAFKLARSTNKRDPLLWAVFGALAIATMWAEAELAEFFVIAGLVTLFARARPTRAQALTAGLGGAAVVAAVWLIERWVVTLKVGGEQVLLQILVFFTKAGAFVFGSGLAIVPFLHQGVVQQFGWLNEQQFIDAVAVAMITPGPVVITVAFIGFLAAGFLGAVAAAIGIFLPVYLFTIIPAPWFSRNRDNALLKGVCPGRDVSGHRRHRRCRHPPGPARDLRRADGRRRAHQSGRAVAIQGAGADPRRGGWYRRPDRLPVLQVLNDRAGTSLIPPSVEYGRLEDEREREQTRQQADPQRQADHHLPPARHNGSPYAMAARFNVGADGEDQDSDDGSDAMAHARAGVSGGSTDGRPRLVVVLVDARHAGASVRVATLRARARGHGAR